VTFSSRQGKGLTGILELPPNASPYTNILGMTFHLIPAGVFIMGSPPGEPGRYEYETQHEVILTAPFYMQTTEVTQSQWHDLIGNNPAAGNTGDWYPVENVTWFEAAYFANVLSEAEGRSPCYSLIGCSNDPGLGMTCTGVEINADCSGYRLPTEAEWEYAARAGTETSYAGPVYFDAANMETSSGFNTNLHAMGWYAFNNTTTYPTGTKPVARKQPNPWGLYDMHGNVWEWCQDWQDDYPDGPVTDPQGPADGFYRITRGGSYSYEAREARSANREWATPGYRGSIQGFRLVLSQVE
jgi:formylglycine-generating enzyme required for sulfatase activity